MVSVGISWMRRVVRDEDEVDEVRGWVLGFFSGVGGCGPARYEVTASVIRSPVSRPQETMPRVSPRAILSTKGVSGGVSTRGGNGRAGFGRAAV
jgi:hypothetical protein